MHQFSERLRLVKQARQKMLPKWKAARIAERLVQFADGYFKSFRFHKSTFRSALSKDSTLIAEQCDIEAN